MKRICSALAVLALAFLAGACEKHSATELEAGHGSGSHETPKSPGPDKHATDPAHPGAKPAEQTGEPAKFFPQSK